MFVASDLLRHIPATTTQRIPVISYPSPLLKFVNLQTPITSFSQNRKHAMGATGQEESMGSKTGYMQCVQWDRL
jgi:hypothetical protein